MISDTEELPPEVKVEPDRPKDPDEAMMRIAEGMEAMIKAERAGGYHLKFTSWTSPEAKRSGRIEISTHAKNLGDVLQELIWIRDVLDHYEERAE